MGGKTIILQMANCFVQYLKKYFLHIQIHLVQFIGEKSCPEFVEPFPALKRTWLKNQDFKGKFVKSIFFLRLVMLTSDREIQKKCILYSYTSTWISLVAKLSPLNFHFFFLGQKVRLTENLFFYDKIVKITCFRYFKIN